MALAIHKVDPSPERLVLIGLLTDRTILATVVSYWREGGLFASKWSNLVASWAIDHFRRYERAPGTAIQLYYNQWIEKNRDDEVSRMVESLLVGLSEERAQLRQTLTVDHLVALASSLFEKVDLQRLNDRVAQCLITGDLDKARTAIERSKRFSLCAPMGISVATDREALQQALAFEVEPLVEYPDALGSFFGTSLYRGAFVAFMGREKAGKSWVLQDLAWRAAEQGRNVAYFECGDSTQNEFLQRYIARICGRPLKAYKNPRRLPIDQIRYSIPLKMETQNERRELPNMDYDVRRHERDLSPEELDLAVDDLSERWGNRFRLDCHPSGSVSVRTIDSILEAWERSGWAPDLCVIDYADILEPIDRRYERRDQVNETWMAMRGLSQKRNCLVATATQTAASGYDEWLLSLKNYSEDKRKYGHVTSMFGINRTDTEKEAGLWRLNFVGGISRNMEVLASQCVWAAGCLAIAQPFMLSSF